jgi:hypothetical protein
VVIIIHVETRYPVFVHDIGIVKHGSSVIVCHFDVLISTER